MMEMELKPFLCRPPLLPDESLASYIYRVALANGHSPNIVNQLCSEKLCERDNVFRPDRSETYNILAQLLDLPPYKIYWASLHGYASLVVPHNKEMKAIAFENGLTFPVYPVGWYYPKHFRFEVRMQYCPYCLEEALYHRRIWYPRAVSACIKHQCLLLNRCPHCEKKISIQNLITGTCNRCKESLITSDCVDLSADDLGLDTQKIIYYWFNGGAYEWSTLPRVSVRDIYDVFFAFMNMLFTDMNSMEGLHSIPGHEGNLAVQEKRYVAAATAMQAFLNWPDGFVDFMNRYARRDGKSFSMDARHHFDYLFLRDDLDRWAANEAYSFYYERLVDYFASNMTFSRLHRYRHFRSYPVPAEKFTWMQEKEVAEELGITRKIVKRMIANGIISWKEGRQKFGSRYFLRKDVVALKERWQHSVPLFHAAVWLGLSEDIVVDLIAEDLLEVAETGQDGASIRGVSRASLETLWESIHARRSEKYKTRIFAVHAVNLTEAATKLSPYGFNEAKLIRLAVRREILCHPPYEDLFVGMRFPIWELAFLIREIDPGSLIDGLDVAERMRVNTKIMGKWIALGLITPHFRSGHGYHFKREDAEKFEATFVARHEAAVIAQVLPETIQAWTWSGLLTPVPGTDSDEGKGVLYKRKDIERFVAENRLIIEQLSKEVEVLGHRIGQLMNERKVRPQ